MKLYNMKLYHGTPHDFNKFDTEHIGSGEGHQVHGWGLYFAENKNVAINYYKNRMLGMYTEVIVDGNAYKFTLKNVEDDIYDSIPTLPHPLGAYIYDEMNIEDAVSKIENQIERQKAMVEHEDKTWEDNLWIRDLGECNRREYVDVLNHCLTYINEHKLSFRDVVPDSYVFTIEVSDNLVFAEEDKLIVEQSDDVRLILFNYQKERLETAVKDTPDYFDDIGGIDAVLSDWMNDTVFGDWYNTYKVNDEYNQKDVSLLLESLGINGITYEGVRDGRCYVIFNPNNIKIIEKE